MITSKFDELYEIFSAGRGSDPEASQLFERSVLPLIGRSEPADVTGEQVERAVAEATLRAGGGETGEKVIAELDDFLRFTERELGIVLPEVRAATGIGDWPDADFLRETILLKTTGRRVLLWIAMNTALPVARLLALRFRDISVRAGVCRVKSAFEAMKGKPVKIPAAKEAFTVASEEAASTVKTFLRSADNPEAFIGTGKTDTLPGLAALRKEAEKIGEDAGHRLTLEMLVAFRPCSDDLSELPERTRPQPLTGDDAQAGTEEERKEEPAPAPVWTDIADEKLDEVMMSSLPKPLRDHAERCGKIAGFVIAQFDTEDWFLDLGLAPDDLVRAAKYHDIGKTKVALDDYYLSGRAGEDKKEKYFEHCAFGVTALGELGGAAPEGCPDESRDGILRDAVFCHHEQFGGRGFPGVLSGEGIPFPARLAAVADAVDHTVFDADDFGEQAVKERISAALAEIGNSSGRRFDPKISAALLANPDRFSGFLLSLTEDAGDRTGDLGMHFVFYPFSDSKSQKIEAYGSELYIGDPYYGEVKADTVKKVLDDSTKFFAFEKLEFLHLCRLVSALNVCGAQIPTVIVEISLATIRRKTALSAFAKMIADCGNLYHKIAIGIDEQEIIACDDDYTTYAERIHALGLLFAVTNFGGKTTLLPSLSKLLPDIVVMRGEYGRYERDVPAKWEVLVSVIQACDRYSVKLFIKGVDNERKATKLSKSGAVYCSGDLIGSALSEKDLTEKYSAT